MKLASYYFKLQVKKSIRVIPVFLISIFLMILLSVIGILFAGCIAKDASSFTKVKVAIVIPDENETSKQMMSFVHAMENVNAVCDFLYMTEEVAEQGLMDGTVDVEMLISPDFYDDVNSGVNSPVTVRMAKSNQYESTVFKELLADGVQLIQVTEASIYGTGYALRQFDMKNTVSEMEDLFTKVYVAKILQRGETFSQTIISPIGKQKLSQYYTTAVLLMIVVMTGMCFGFLYQGEEFQIVKLLRGRGLTPMVVSIVKTTTMAFQLWIFITVCYGMILLYSTITQSAFLYGNWSVFVKILVVSVSIAAYFHMIYSCFSKSGNGGFIIFICNVLMCIFSGILVPFSGVPEEIALGQRFVPFAIWQQYMNEVFFGDVTLMVFVKILIMTIAFEMIGVFCVCKKT